MRPAAPILLARTTAARLTGMHRPLLLARTAEARSSGIRRRPVAPLLPTARTMAARSNGIGRQLGDCGGAAPLPPARPTTARSIRMRQQLSNGGSAGGGSAPPGVDGGCEFKRDAAGGSAPPVMPLATMTHQRRRQHRDSGNGRGRGRSRGVSMPSTSSTSDWCSIGISTDTLLVQDGIGEKVNNFIHYITTFLAALVVGFFAAWRLALLSVAVIPGPGHRLRRRSVCLHTHRPHIQSLLSTCH
uniref:ABC transmembrane type-1 domain-containing protein n=1 Tax=Leersia perrieri TaxID=77586 RepID=A0A0D9X5G7_9ORYZ